MKALAVANAVLLAGGVIAWRAGMLPPPPGMMTPKERQLLSGSKSYSFAGLAPVTDLEAKTLESIEPMTPGISVSSPSQYPQVGIPLPVRSADSANLMGGGPRTEDFRNPYELYRSGHSASMSMSMSSSKSILLLPDLVWPMFLRLFPDASPISLPEFSTATPPGQYLHGRTP